MNSGAHIALLLDALEQPDTERKAYVEERAGPDTVLRDRVWRLLDRVDDSDTFFDQVVEQVSERQLQEVEEFQYRGQRIGNYRIDHLLAMGGMGSVFAASRADGAFERTVIIKMLPLALDSPHLVNRFSQEQRVLASLSHPHIAQLHDAGVDPTHGAYFVMEYVDGDTITDYANTRRLGRQQRLSLFVDLLGAVQFAHSNLIIHSDIKPSNVMVDTEGTVKLLDFGIARTVGSDRMRAQTAYSPAYAAPEQADGGAITTATDTYQCGLLLFELLIGQSYSSCDHHESRLRGLPSELAAILRKALCKSAEKRYPTAREMAEEFHRLRQHLPLAAILPTVGYRLRCFIRRHRLAAALLGISLLVSLVLAWQASRLAEERDRVVAASEQLVRERDRAVRISDFLIGVFESARPENSPGAVPDAEDILDNGLDQIRFRFSGLPSTQVEFLVVIAQTYQSLGKIDRAASILDEARALYVATDNADPLTGARLALATGENLRMQGHLDQAIEALRSSISTLETLATTIPAARDELAQAYGRLGRVHTLKGEFDAARARLQHAATLVGSRHGEESLDYAQALNDLAAVDFSEGHHAEVARHLTRALEIRDTLAATNPNVRLDPDYATNVNNLGLVHFRLGDLEKAEELFRSAVELREEIYRDAHPEQAQSLTNLGLVLDAEGHGEEARELLEQALTIRRQTFGGQHMRVAESLNNLGMLHLSQARFNEALEMYLLAFPILSDQLGDDHPVTATLYSNMGQARLELGDLEQALIDYEHSLDIREQRLAQGHLFTSYSELGVGRTLTRMGQLEKAEPHLQRALAIRQRQLPADHWLVGETMLALAGWQQAQGISAQAHALQAYTILMASKGEDFYLTQRAAALLEGDQS